VSKPTTIVIPIAGAIPNRGKEKTGTMNQLHITERTKPSTSAAAMRSSPPNKIPKNIAKPVPSPSSRKGISTPFKEHQPDHPTSIATAISLAIKQLSKLKSFCPADVSLIANATNTPFRFPNLLLKSISYQFRDRGICRIDSIITFVQKQMF
jgi:hypothetical protein